MTGELDRLARFAGQVSGQVVEVTKADELVAAIVRDAEATLERLSTTVRA